MFFEKAFELLIGNEGKFKKEYRDRMDWTGGKVGVGELKGTKYGITAGTYPHLDIQNISLAQARWIYREDFWDVMQLDYLPDSIKFDMFDTGVNSGVHRANKLLQVTVGLTGKAVDGIVGKQTLAAVKAYDVTQIDKRFNARRLLFITSLSRQQWEDYGKGWTVRIANNMLND